MDMKETLDKLTVKTREGLVWQAISSYGWSVSLCGSVVFIVFASGQIAFYVDGKRIYDGTEYATELKDSGLVVELQNRFKFDGSLQEGLDAVNKCLDMQGLDVE